MFIVKWNISSVNAGFSPLLYTVVYEIWDEGSNHINGMALRDLEWQTMRERIGMVLQVIWFFSGTIFENAKLRITRLSFLSLEAQPAMIFIISLLPLRAKLGRLHTLFL